MLGRAVAVTVYKADPSHNREIKAALDSRFYWWTLLFFSVIGFSSATINVGMSISMSLIRSNHGLGDTNRLVHYFVFDVRLN